MTAIASRSWPVFFLVQLTKAIAYIDLFIIPVALPALTRAFNMTSVSSIWVINIYQMSEAMTFLLAGPLSRRIGERNVINAGSLIFGLGCVICGFSHQVPTLLLGRAIMGIGGALVQPMGLMVLLTLFPKEKLPVVSIIARLFSLTLAMVSPLVTSLLIHYLSWQWIFWVNIPLALICFIGCRLWLPKHEGAPMTYPYISAMFSVLGGGLLLGTLMHVKMFGITSAWVWVGFGISAVFIVLFIMKSLKDKIPIVNLGLFKYRYFYFSMIQLFFFAMAGSLLTFWIIFLGESLGKTTLSIGFFLLYCQIPALIICPISFWLALKKWGYRPILFILHLLWLFGIMWMAWFYKQTGLHYFFIPVMCASSAFPIIASISYLWLVTRVNAQERNTASSFVTASMHYAGAIGLAIFSVGFTLINEHNSQNIMESFKIINWIGFVFTLISTVFVCLIKKKHEDYFTSQKVS